MGKYSQQITIHQSCYFFWYSFVLFSRIWLVLGQHLHHQKWWSSTAPIKKKNRVTFGDVVMWQEHIFHSLAAVCSTLSTRPPRREWSTQHAFLFGTSFLPFKRIIITFTQFISAAAQIENTRFEWGNEWTVHKRGEMPTLELLQRANGPWNTTSSCVNSIVPLCTTFQHLTICRNVADTPAQPWTSVLVLHASVCLRMLGRVVL